MTKSEKETIQGILDDMYDDNDDVWYIERLVGTLRKMINYKPKEEREQERLEEDN